MLAIYSYYSVISVMQKYEVAECALWPISTAAQCCFWDGLGSLSVSPPQVGGGKMLINSNLDKFKLNSLGGRAFVKMSASWVSDSLGNNEASSRVLLF